MKRLSFRTSAGWSLGDQCSLVFLIKTQRSVFATSFSNWYQILQNRAIPVDFHETGITQAYEKQHKTIMIIALTDVKYLSHYNIQEL